MKRLLFVQFHPLSSPYTLAKRVVEGGVWHNRPQPSIHADLRIVERVTATRPVAKPCDVFHDPRLSSKQYFPFQFVLKSAEA